VLEAATNLNELIKCDDSLTVFKSNKLIEARYDLTLNEQKLTLYAASKVDNFTGQNFTVLRMPTSDFYRMTGMDEKSKNHSYVKDLVRGLMKKQLEIENEDGVWESYQWVNRSKYIPKTGIIEFEFNDALKPFLLMLEGRYKGYPLREVLQLNSKYSIRLYELLIQWEYTTHKTLTLKIDELRRKMGLTKEYKRFTNFETYVIQTAVDELNEKSNIKVSYEKIKKGRRIDSIKFCFMVNEKAYEKELNELHELMEAGLANHIKLIRDKLNSEGNLAFNDLELDSAHTVTFNKLVNFDILNDYFTEALLSYIRYYFDYTLDMANNKAFNYFIKALKEDYHNISVFLKMGEKPESIKYEKK